MNIKSTIAGVLAGLVVGGGGIAYAGVEATNEVPRWMTRPCAQEDSNNCQWNAHTEGNGRGWSFYSRKIPGTHRTCIFYIDHPHQDFCTRSSY